MAYVQPIQKQQLEDLTQKGGGAITTTGASSDSVPNATTLTQATAAPGAVANQFVNFQDLVDANADATTDYSKGVGNLIGYGDTASTLNDTTNTANSSIDNGWQDIDESIIDQVLANPTNTGINGFSRLQSILGGNGYGGPSNAADLYANAKSNVDALSGKAQSLDDVNSLKSLILAKPNQGSTAGGASLDAALLANTAGSKQQIKTVQDQVAGLQKQYADNVQASQGAIAAKKSQAEARRQGIVGKASNTLGQIRSENDAELAALNAAENAKVAEFQAAVQAKDFAKLNALLPGLDTLSIQRLASDLATASGINTQEDDYGHLIETAPYATATGPQLTTGNVLTDAEKSRYQGIQNIFGITPDEYIKLAGQGANIGFDSNSLMGQLQGRLQAQQQANAAAARAAANAAAQAAAQKAYDAAVRAGQNKANATAAAQNAWTDAGGDPTGIGAAAPSGIDAPNDASDQGNAVGTIGAPVSANTANAIGTAIGAVTGVPGLGLAAMGVNEAIGMAPAAAPTGNTTAAAMSQMDAQAAENNGQAAGGIGGIGSTSGDSADGTAGVGVGEGGIGSSGAGTAAGDAAGNSEGSGGAAAGGGIGGGDSAGGGGGGGGKIICTAMNDLYGLPYRENKIWLMYAKRHLTPAHEKGYHKVFLPLVDYGFKQGDGILNLAVRDALIWIGKNRTSDIKNELAGKKRNLLHKTLRAIAEPLLGFIGRRTK